MPRFRKTWRHEVYIEAHNAEQAEDIWQGLNLGNLDKEEKLGDIEAHGIVEEISFEDEDYNDVFLDD